MSSENGLPAAVRAASWARTLSGLRDPALQVGWLRERLRQDSPSDTADVLTVVLARAEQREEPYGVLLLRASIALADKPALRSAIGRVARSRGQTALARFLGGHPSDPSPEGDDKRSRVADAQTGRTLTLGERKSLARRLDRGVLARVLQDPHPDVIRILLDNPALREADVVRLCARRPGQPAVLGEIFRHPRWVSRYHVQLSLVLNPHTPEEIALQLLPHLTPNDRREVLRSLQLPATVRDACREPGEDTAH